MPSHRQSTADRILDSAVRVITEKGFHDAPLLAIATGAGSSNSSVLSIFGSKKQLMEAVYRRELQGLEDTVPDPTDDLREDLLTLATRYVAFYRERKVLMLSLGHIMQEPKLREILGEEQRKAAARLTVLCGHHKDEKNWSPKIQSVKLRDINEKVSTPFLGGLFAKVLWDMLGLSGKSVAEEQASDYVDLFLGGYGAQAPHNATRNKDEVAIAHDSLRLWDIENELRKHLAECEERPVRLSRFVDLLEELKRFSTRESAGAIGDLISKLQESGSEEVSYFSIDADDADVDGVILIVENFLRSARRNIEARMTQGTI